jgi:hypothetical protein
MTTVSKHFLIVLGLSAAVLAQSAPRKSHASASRATAAASGKKGQKEAAAKNSGHPSTMSGNHKDMMMGTAANPNQASGSHNNMMGNHKDMMMGTAANPSTGNKTQPTAAPAAAPAPNPTPASSQPAAPAPKSPRWKR